MVSFPREFGQNPAWLAVQVGNTLTDGASLHKPNTQHQTPLLRQTLENANTASPDLGDRNKLL